MSYPLVSVILPVYNAEKYIGEAIESIVNQTFINWELIIVDDASTDATADIVKRFTDDRIIYVRNPENLGVSASSNLGAVIAKGEFLMKQDADDISLPNRMEISINYFSNDSIDVLTGGAIFFNHTGELKISQTQLRHNEIKARLLLSCPIMNPTLMVRKKAIEKLDYWYDIQYKGPEDYDFFCRAIDEMNFYCTGQVLIKYRIHDSPDRLSNKLNKEHYFNSTKEIRARFWQKNGLADISDKWVPFYEALFYHRNQLDFNTAKAISEFYQIFWQKCIQLFDNQLPKKQIDGLKLFIRHHFSNHFYGYAKIGTRSLAILWRSKHLSSYSVSQYFKFFIKALVSR